MKHWSRRTCQNRSSQPRPPRFCSPPPTVIREPKHTSPQLMSQPGHQCQCSVCQYLSGKGREFTSTMMVGSSGSENAAKRLVVKVRTIQGTIGLVTSLLGNNFNNYDKEKNKYNRRTFIAVLHPPISPKACVRAHRQQRNHRNIVKQRLDWKRITVVEGDGLNAVFEGANTMARRNEGRINPSSNDEQVGVSWERQTGRALNDQPGQNGEGGNHGR